MVPSSAAVTSASPQKRSQGGAQRHSSANQISIDKVPALFVAPDRTQPTSVPSGTDA